MKNSKARSVGYSVQASKLYLEARGIFLNIIILPWRPEAITLSEMHLQAHTSTEGLSDTLGSRSLEIRYVVCRFTWRWNQLTATVANFKSGVSADRFRPWDEFPSNWSEGSLPPAPPTFSSWPLTELTNLPLKCEVSYSTWPKAIVLGLLTSGF